MSTDQQPKKLPPGVKDWPGREQGVPPPPTPAQTDEISEQQGLITDEWAPEAAPEPGEDDYQPKPPG